MFGRFFRTSLSADTPGIFDSVLEGDITIDCGANVGLVTEKLANRGAEVFAFEPNPHAYKILSQKFHANSKVHCLQQAVGDRQTTRKLFFHEFAEADPVKWSTGSSLLDFKSNINPDNSVDVPVIDLVEFIQSLKKTVRLIKIDVEGGEIEIIQKLLEHPDVLNQISMIYVETHERKIPELKAPTEAIRKELKRRKIKNINLNWT